MKCEIGRFGWSRAGNAAAIEPVWAIRPEKSLVALLQVIVIRQCPIRRRVAARANKLVVCSSVNGAMDFQAVRPVRWQTR